MSNFETGKPPVNEGEDSAEKVSARLEKIKSTQIGDLSPEELMLLAGERQALAEEEMAPKNASENNESLDQRERALQEGIAQEVENFNTAIQDIEVLAEDEALTPPLRERLLSSLDTIGSELQKTFMIRFGGSVAIGGMLALQEYLIQTDQTIVDPESILGYANKGALAGIALYATIKGVQYAGYKVKEFMVKKGIEKGTVLGGADAASFITEGRRKAELDTDDDLDISHEEHMELYDDQMRIFKEERVPRDALDRVNTPDSDERWKKFMERTRTEASRLLAK